MSYERFVAYRYLRSSSEGFLSTITLIAIAGIFLGVMALTSVISVTGGFEEAFRERVLGINSHLLVLRFGIDFRQYREIQDDIERVPGVKATSPFILHEMIATKGERSAGVLVKGIEPKTLETVSDLPKYLIDAKADMFSLLEYDRWPDDGVKAPPTIMIGQTLADRLGAKVGDEIRLTSPLESLDPDRWKSNTYKPSFHAFRLIGIYKSGFHDYDNRLMMVDYRALQDFFKQPDVVTGIDVRVHDVFAVGRINRAIKEILPSGRFRTMDWRELNHNLFTSLGMQRLVLVVLFCFIVLVASFNIACTLIMMVLDKQKDIAILKSMGASTWAMTKVFVFQGLAIALIGTVSGLLGGIVVCTIIKYTDFGLDPKIYMIDHLPVRIVPVELAAIGLLAMMIALAATIGPSIWAASLKPVDGLRYE